MRAPDEAAAQLGKRPNPTTCTMNMTHCIPGSEIRASPKCQNDHFVRLCEFGNIMSGNDLGMNSTCENALDMIAYAMLESMIARIVSGSLPCTC